MDQDLAIRGPLKECTNTVDSLDRLERSEQRKKDVSQWERRARKLSIGPGGVDVHFLDTQGTSGVERDRMLGQDEFVTQMDMQVLKKRKNDKENVGVQFSEGGGNHPGLVLNL